MFDDKELKKVHCVTTVEKLLWNINENLKVLRAELPTASMELAPEQQGDGLRHCKKCEFTCANQADLMRHYQQAHPKDEVKG